MPVHVSYRTFVLTGVRGTRFGGAVASGQAPGRVSGSSPNPLTDHAAIAHSLSLPTWVSLNAGGRAASAVWISAPAPHAPVVRSPIGRSVQGWNVVRR